jgi:peptide/nickel transport system substrate-binding protein
MLYDNLRKIGINLDMKPGLWSTNWQKAKNIKTAPNIISMAWWPTYPTPSDWFFSLYKTQKNPLFNLSYYSNPVVDSLIQTAWSLESIHPEKATLIYKNVQEIIINDCVVIPATDLNIQSVYNNEIIGFEKNPAYATLFFYNLKRKN